jgi:hypothetical protein
MNREFSEKEYDFVEVTPDKYIIIRDNKKYQTFELWENLQNLDEQTLRLMSKGFLEKITNRSLEKHIRSLAEKYRKEWKAELWESEDIEEFAMNEFIGGKAEAYEDCLETIKIYEEI